MLKQGLQQKMQQRLSPLQIQTIKLLELPALELEQRIKKELEENPVLEDSTTEEQEAEEQDNAPKQVSLSEYKDDTPSYKLYINNRGRDEKPQYNTFSEKESFRESLVDQLDCLCMDKNSHDVALFLIGSLDGDGYLRRSFDSLSDDIYLRLNIEFSPQELEKILTDVIQKFDPVGVGARSLQECLILQIKAREERSPAVENAQIILSDYFDDFTKKHYPQILSKTGMSHAELKEAIEEIVRLNPRPGGGGDEAYASQAQQIIPDFILENDDGKLSVSMPRYNTPELRLNKQYSDMIQKHQSGIREDKEVANFVKQKLESAKWFIKAIKQRQNTLQNTINAIIDFQKDFFYEGDETKLKPMVLRNIAEKTGLDISTISRVVNSKYIRTPFGTYPLKYFFSEGMQKETGEEVSTREIKKILSQCVEEEDKTNPLTDDELVNLLKEKGYVIARRTVAKYRDQLSIPIARLRREL